MERQSSGVVECINCRVLKDVVQLRSKTKVFVLVNYRCLAFSI
jgi:hypothetical protein